MNEARNDDSWPALPYEHWRETKDTLHRYAQVVGKIRMALAPFRNHWWHVTLQVGTHGLHTGPMPLKDGRTAQLGFDFVSHQLTIDTSNGAGDRFELHNGLSSARFYAELFGRMQGLGIDADIDPTPYDIGGPLLSEDTGSDRYDAEFVARYWQILRSTARVLEEFAGWFNGKQSPVHLFWHSFDLAYGRYSGRAAPARPHADAVTAEAYSHEVIAFGFWPGDASSPAPAYYCYTAPTPEGLTDQSLVPATAWWNIDSGTAYLDYEQVRTSASPRDMLLDFWSSAYDAGARCADWDVDAFATSAYPAGRGLR